MKGLSRICKGQFPEVCLYLVCLIGFNLKVPQLHPPDRQLQVLDLIMGKKSPAWALLYFPGFSKACQPNYSFEHTITIIEDDVSIC